MTETAPSAFSVAPSTRRRRAQIQRREEITTFLSQWWARLVLAFFLYFSLVGYAPLARDIGGESSALRPLTYIAVAAAVLPLILLRWRIALALIWRSWAMLLVFAAMGLTVLWSQFPGTSVRRILLFVLLYITAIGVVAVLNTPRLFLPVLATVLAGVLLANFAVAPLYPELTWSPIGYQGLHLSKNLAGMLGQVMAIVFAGMLVALRQPALFWVTVVLTLLAFFFVAMTISKTAMGITIVCVLGVLPLLVLTRWSPRLGAIAITALLVIAGVATVATGALTLNTADWAGIITGDPTLTERDDIWHAANMRIADAPYLGYGFGAVWSMLPQYHPLAGIAGFWTESEATLRILNQSHNGYIDLYLHGGVFFFAVVMLFVAKTLIDILINTFQHFGDRWDLAGQSIFGTFFVGFLLSNILESTLFFPDGLLGVLMIFLVIASSAWRMRARQMSMQSKPLVKMWTRDF